MGALEPTRQQHAEALMGEPSLEGITDEIMPLPARKGLDQDLVGARHDRHLALNAQPVRDLIRQPRPMAPVGKQPPARKVDVSKIPLTDAIVLGAAKAKNSPTPAVMTTAPTIKPTTTRKGSPCLPPHAARHIPAKITISEAPK